MKRKILKYREVDWRMKRRAVWLGKGDENTKFFENYAKNRKRTNITCEMYNFEGNTIRNFIEVA